MNGKEFWKVEIRNTKYSSDGGTVYVIAKSAGVAEKRAIAQKNADAKKDNGVIEGRFYAKSAELIGYIY